MGGDGVTVGSSVGVPACYVSGYERARALDPERASSYIAHTLIGDPLADTLLEDLAGCSREEQTLLFQAVIGEHDWGALSGLPSSVRAFFDDAESVPGWVDFSEFAPGVRMFHRNSKLILGAFVGGTLIEGFATNISKSFFITGRLRDQGVRRLRQNNRHMIEIFMPDGLTRDGDGRNLSVRIRLIHAQIRRLLRSCGDWDAEAWGTPISSAHLGYAVTAFSAGLLGHMKKLGATCSSEERKSFMAVWRYTGHLMGIPESILFRNEEDALRLAEIGFMCEPQPDMESIAVANSLVNAAPLVIGIDDPAERRKLARYVYRISRALIGNDLADQLGYPGASTFGALAVFRLLGRCENVRARLGPQRAGNSDFERFTSLLDASLLEETGISYRLPDHAHAEESSRW